MAKIKTIIIFLGDIILLYGALFLTLIVRYGPQGVRGPLSDHLTPFTLLFVGWLLIFYLSDFYQIRAMKVGFGLMRNISAAVLISGVVSITFFYLFTPLFRLTPKTNLLIFGLIFAALDFSWRLLIIRVFMPRYARRRILTIGNSKTIEEIVSELEKNPHIGYDAVLQIKEDSGEANPKILKELIVQKKIDTLVIPSHFLKKDLPTTKLVYQLLPLKIEILNSIDFFELIFQKIPLDELDEGWFIKEITLRRRFYDIVKRGIDILMSLVLGIFFLPLGLVIGILTKMSPREGPVILKQKRTGINNTSFTLYKFGTMRKDAGALWTTVKDDRITAFGAFLRYTHLDEIPQLWNILRGDISFIGPRAERIELVELYSELPYYEMRHIIKPGLTGWAQLNYRASSSLEEANEKLKYDIYYIKNRSLFLDILIILKTVRLLFSNPS